MYDTRPFWTRYYSIAFLHVISLQSQDILSGNYGIRVGGFKVLLKLAKEKRSSLTRNQILKLNRPHEQ